NAAIEQELQNNPLLEAANQISKALEDQSFRLKLNTMNTLNNIPSSDFNDFSDEDGDLSSPIAYAITLTDHLIEQLHWEIEDPKERIIGEFIIGNLDQSGYLSMSVQDIAQAVDISDIRIVEGILAIVQDFEPL